MFTLLDIPAVVVLFTVFAVTAIAQCSKKKSPGNAAPSSGTNSNCDNSEGGSIAKASSQSNQLQKTPSGDGGGNADNKSSEAPKSCAKNLDKTQTQDQHGKTGEGNEGAPKGGEKLKDDEDTFEQHKPVPKEAKGTNDIVSNPSTSKARDNDFASTQAWGGYLGAVRDQKSLPVCMLFSTLGVLSVFWRQNFVQLLSVYYEPLLKAMGDEEKAGRTKDNVGNMNRAFSYVNNLNCLQFAKFKFDDFEDREVFGRFLRYLSSTEYIEDERPVLLGISNITKGFRYVGKLKRADKIDMGLCDRAKTKNPEKVLGEHIALVVGASLTDNTITIRNTWTSEWGFNGFGRLALDSQGRLQLSAGKSVRTSVPCYLSFYKIICNTTDNRICSCKQRQVTTDRQLFALERYGIGRELGKLDCRSENSQKEVT